MQTLVCDKVTALTVAQAIEKLEGEIAAKTVRKSYGGNAGLGERGAGNEY